MVIASDFTVPQKIYNAPKLKFVTKEPVDGYTWLRYDSQYHRHCPHVVKFSGGRTSGMMLFTLLENGLLDARRGDVVVFNNTSAEHPATYDFVRRCKELVESKYGIPFYIIEFQTYEKNKGLSYRRASTFRLANSRPYDKQDNPNGYRWRGEIFEEMISWRSYLPNLFQRTCTQYLKVETTNAFLKEWFNGTQGIERLGHNKSSPQIQTDHWFDGYKNRGGKRPAHVYKRIKSYLWRCAHVRPAQLWKDYSSAWAYHGYANEIACNDEIEFLSFVGLRHDEQRRVVRFLARNRDEVKTKGKLQEHVYLPLDTLRVNADDVMRFWRGQTWGLQLNPNDNLSNCTFCFLKGPRKLARAYQALRKADDDELKGTPSDIEWWKSIEHCYGRNNREDPSKAGTPYENDFIGFFTLKSGLTYKAIKDYPVQVGDLFDESSLPCDCTD